ncbi:MAG TPA: hypothetical protein ENN90_09495 [Mariniphaga anaerophila]|uniref:Uncharacterized protein n=1 Tax=Mariniphaga anaerophila TaxID=1484053 RepID=A0A831PRC6_9BACT|nr:hypothetical protein [Mariniphaga anaerophila]
MKNFSYKNIGIILSIAGIFTGLLLFYLLAQNYMIVVDGKVADGRVDEAIAVEITHSILGSLGIIASALWAAVLYGFFYNQQWAWRWGAMAAALQMLAGFFPTIPARSIDLPAATMPVFLIAVVLWFGMMYAGRVNRKVIIFTFVAGLAYVLTYINGVAVISRYQYLGFDTDIPKILKGMYAVVQMSTWMGAAAWLVFIYVVFRHRKWALPLGIMAAANSILSGYTLAIVELTEKGGVFSLYLPGAIVATGLLVYMLTPHAKILIEERKAGIE